MLFDFWGEKMKTQHGFFCACLCASTLMAAGSATQSTTSQGRKFASALTNVDAVGDVEGRGPAPRTATLDTVWLADWTFDTGAGACDGNGWLAADNAPPGDATGTCPSTPGLWARLFSHPIDTDVCTENTSCAWVFFDPTPCRPSDLLPPCVPPCIDNVVTSPWVPLGPGAGAPSAVLSFREFPGQGPSSEVWRNWAVRGRYWVDDPGTPTPGDSMLFTTPWQASPWTVLSGFTWMTRAAYAGAQVDPASIEIQVRFRVSDGRWHGAPPPATPAWYGPYIDRVRVGRLVTDAPLFDEGLDGRSQAQDAFPTEIHPGVTPGTGEHHQPTTDRFGTTAFSQAADLGVESASPNIVTGDSVTIAVRDVRGAGGITSVKFYGAVVRGPHSGLAPPPYSVGVHGFFEVDADTSRTPETGQPVEGHFFVDLDDEYFVGGDELHYFWAATDALGGFASHPPGLNAAPASIAAAQEATGGLFEFSALPEVQWDEDYLAAVAISNKVDPHSDPAYLDESSQYGCTLYVNRTNTRRRSGDINRTSFMYVLDKLGFGTNYDVYDHMGMGNTNNHLGGRATIEQAQGYYIIVYDAGNAESDGTIVPDGSDLDSQKVDQAGWFESWLAQAPASEAGFATLWILGSNVLEERPSHPLYTNSMGTTLVSAAQGTHTNPDVLGQGSFAFESPWGSPSVDFTVGAKAEYSLSGGCSDFRDYDAQSAGLGINVFRFADPFTGTTGDAAVVMNSNPSALWNTILMSHPWRDMREDFGHRPGSLTSAEDLWRSVATAVLPSGWECWAYEDFSDADPGAGAPRRTALYANTPNPFNPVTTIPFDLARDAHVQLRVYDVFGRLVRTLVDGSLERKRHRIVWDGVDDAGTPVSSGVYFYRLETDGYTDAHKMIVLR